MLINRCKYLENSNFFSLNKNYPETVKYHKKWKYDKDEEGCYKMVGKYGINLS